MPDSLKPILALSTCWCSPRQDDGYAMLVEIAELGFTHVELSHGIRITLVPGILRAVEEGIIQVSSVHNFCPLPPGVNQAAPNLFEPSASDPREHDQWLRYTRRSLEFAAQVGARIMVCHLGSVRFLWRNPGTLLDRHLAAHPETAVASDPAYRKLLDKADARIRRRMGPYWERTQASVREVLGDAAAKGVRLGFENRERFDELPLDPDYPDFIGRLPADASAGYWHDVGHADLKQAMGVLDHRAHLERMSGRLLGFHLHDVSAEGRDHQPIGSGRIDFEMVSSFWRPEHLLVLELSPRVSVDGVRASREQVLELMAARMG